MEPKAEYDAGQPDWLEEIKQRAEAVSSRPWRDYVTGYSMNGRTDGERYHRVILDDSKYVTDLISEHDAAFVVHARSDIPRLIAEVERLRGLVKQAEWLGEGGTSCQYCGVIRVVRDTDRLREHAPWCPAFSAPGVVR